MNNILKGVMTIVVLIGAGIIAVGLVATAPEPKKFEPEEVSTAIRIATVEQQQVRLKVRSQGTVAPKTESSLIAEVAGRIEWTSPNLVSGGYFNENDVLVRLDDEDLQAAVQSRKASFARAKAESEFSNFEYKRLQELVKSNLTSQSSLESASRSKSIAEAILKESAVALKQAERDLTRTEVRAPYDGLVRSKNVDVGQFISRGSNIASLYSSESVEVRIPIADRQLAFLDLPLGRRGELPEALKANVLLSTNYGGQRYEWHGKLVRTEAQIDTQTRMVNAVVRVTGEVGSDQPHLPVGLFVHAEIDGRLADNIIVLPRAVLRNQNQVLVVDADNRLRYRNVEVLRFDQDDVFISGGLQTGEIVNLSPIQTVIDGMRVKPVPNAG
ncbi:MAG: efflux RND transporter periplasmic adaptor subunit [Pseudomonadales bacterium]|nr:efflux RND transporter periplasmic adaptor subunit [Pseudomonadales bacterium]MDG1443624.1 efflux RND transporter periplasmic adaptor subunit [Pseudomonadales bacterium]